MRSGFKAAAVAAAALGIALTGSFVAYASWNTQSSSVPLKIRAATMPRGVTPKVTVVGKKAVVRWDAQEVVSGVLVTSYVVTAHSSASATRDVTHTLRATGGPAETVTFTASEVSGGRWSWTIVPKFGSWAGRESRPTKPLTFPADAVAEAVPAVPDPIPSVSPSTAEQRRVEPTTKPTASSEARTVPGVPAPTASASA